VEEVMQCGRGRSQGHRQVKCKGQQGRQTSPPFLTTKPDRCQLWRHKCKCGASR
jgi:hypothetical protein